MDGMLSQEEINALLNGMKMEDSHEVTTGETLTDAEKDAVGEISNISMGTAATTLFSLVNQRVVITTPVVEYATWKDIVYNYDKPCVFIQIYYNEGLDGNNILILKENDVKIIADLMMGGDGTNISGELSELHLSAISEAMNQMMGSAATSISSMLEKRVSITPPIASVVDLDEHISGENIADFLRGSFVKVSFRMEIGDLVDSVLMQLYPFDFARNLYKQFVKATKMEPDAPTRPTQQNADRMTTDNQTAQAPMQQAQMQQAQMQQAQMQQAQMQQQYYMPYQQPMAQQYAMPPMQDVKVQPVQFTPFSQTATPVVQPENIDLLMDVPLEVTVELGRTSKSIKEILDFSPGTIIELNRLAGEPIDILVNGKFVAKGEVVVVEEAFCIRVTEIIKQRQAN
jgi:flagellar motor switch protein FliN/FliY